VPATRWQGEKSTQSTDPLVVEEPLEIRLDGEPVVVTMRTPGSDPELAAGFLFTEGILKSPGQVGTIQHCQDPADPNQINIVEVRLAEGAESPQPGWQRSFYSSSSCGICGKASIEAVRQVAAPVEGVTRYAVPVIYGLPRKLRSGQDLFSETGALHAAGLFSATGELQLLREDVGRHNAVDKVIGNSFLGERLSLPGHLMMVSGRISFEIVQKALMAGIPAIAGVSGVSSLAVELAEEAGMLLMGFLREETMQVYAGSDRLIGA